MILSLLLTFFISFGLTNGLIINNEPDCITGPTNIVSPVLEMGFGIVVCEYKTGKPIKLSWRNVIKPGNDTGTDIPVSFTSATAGDFGNVSVILKDSYDTLFKATWIWMGTGSVIAPANMLDAVTSAGPALSNPKPYVYTVFDETGNVSSDKALKKSSLEAWEKAVNTDQITGYLSPSFRLGAYLYTPSRGKTDWDAARWVFLIFRD